MCVPSSCHVYCVTAPISYLAYPLPHSSVVQGSSCSVLLLIPVTHCSEVKLTPTSKLATCVEWMSVGGSCISVSPTCLCVRVSRFPMLKYGRFLHPFPGAQWPQTLFYCCSCSTTWGSCCFRFSSADPNQNFSHILMKICCIKLPWGFLDLGSN